MRKFADRPYLKQRTSTISRPRSAREKETPNSPRMGHDDRLFGAPPAWKRQTNKPATSPPHLSGVNRCEK